MTMSETHFTYFVFGAQVIAGLLLLFNRYVPLALVVLGAIIANISAFHITMWPATIFPMPIFTQKVEVSFAHYEAGIRETS